MKQRTIKEAFSIKGKGLHTGLPSTITFRPAPVDSGYRIKRVDLEGTPVIRACAGNVKHTQRSTVLSYGGIQVATVEHALAALYGCEMDNCLIEIDAPEFPILDGSSFEYVHQIERTGYLEQPRERVYYEVDKKIEYIDPETGSHLMLLPADTFSVHVQISFDSEVLAVQSACMEKLSDFKREFSMCRTFVFIKEIEGLLKKGLIRGGDLDNAIVIYDQPIQQEELDQLADVMGIKRKRIDRTGYIMNKPLLFPNEPARHKLLDVIGDLALTGRFIKGAIVAVRPGHRVNNLFAREIVKNIPAEPELIMQNESFMA
jgi:UDP-3-O-acyl-N-acetylglucosamine deacetylase